MVSSTELAEEYGIQQSIQDHADGGKTYIYDLSQELPPDADWIELLAGPKPNWLRAFLTSVSVVQGDKKIPNQAPKVFKPRQHQRVKMVVSAQGQPLKVEVGHRSFRFIKVCSLCVVQLFGAIRSAAS